MKEIVYSLNPADAVVLRKKFLGMVDHFAIFMGWERGRPWFVANYTRGVRYLSETETNQFLQTLVVADIERFKGSETERQKALERADSVVGETNYSYLWNNCEHFKNWVHFGRKYSRQVDAAGDASLISGGGLLIAGVASKNPKLAAWGAGFLLLGILLKEWADE